MEKEIEKAISLVELKKDLENIVAQANAMAGAIQYIRNKIAELEKPEVKPKEKTK